MAIFSRRGEVPTSVDWALEGFSSPGRRLSFTWASGAHQMDDDFRQMLFGMTVAAASVDSDEWSRWCKSTKNWLADDFWQSRRSTRGDLNTSSYSWAAEVRGWIERTLRPQWQHEKGPVTLLCAFLNKKYIQYEVRTLSPQSSSMYHFLQRTDVQGAEWAEISLSWGGPTRGYHFWLISSNPEVDKEALVKAAGGTKGETWAPELMTTLRHQRAPAEFNATLWIAGPRDQLRAALELETAPSRSAIPDIEAAPARGEVWPDPTASLLPPKTPTQPDMLSSQPDIKSGRHPGTAVSTPRPAEPKGFHDNHESRPAKPKAARVGDETVARPSRGSAGKRAPSAQAATGIYLWNSETVQTASLIEKGRDRNINQDHARVWELEKEARQYAAGRSAPVPAGLESAQPQGYEMQRQVYQAELEKYQRHGILLVLADGVGGAAAGQLASSIVGQRLGELYYEAMQGDYDRTGRAADPLDALRAGLENINREFRGFNAAQPRDERRFTTVVCLVILDDQAHIAWLGDSQAFLFRTGQKLHETAPEMWRDAQGSGPWVLGDLSEESDDHIRVDRWDLGPEDTLLLCSDGLTRALSPAAIGRELAGEGEPSRLAHRLWRAADTPQRTDDTSFIIARRSAGLTAAEPALPAVANAVAAAAGAKSAKAPTQTPPPAAAATSPTAEQGKKRGSRLVIWILLLLAVIVAAAALAFAFLLPRLNLSREQSTPASVAVRASPTHQLPVSPKPAQPIIITPVDPTNTPEPTATATPTPTATATPTSTTTRTPTSTPRPTRTPTPAPAVNATQTTGTATGLAKPTLLEPPDMWVYKVGQEQQITFRWTADPALTDADCYDWQVESTEQATPVRAAFETNLTETSITRPLTSFVQRGPFRWQVRIVRKTAQGSSAVGPWSEWRYFRIDAQSESPTATPERPKG